MLKMEIDEKCFKEAEDKIRDLINWVAVFEDEFNLPKEVVDTLKKRLEHIASTLGRCVL